MRKLAYLLAIALFLMAMPGVWTQENEEADFKGLQSQAEKALQGKDYARALEIAMKMNDIVEAQHYKTLYGIARIYAFLGNKPKAYEWLDRAVGAGFWDAQLMRNDEAFSSSFQYRCLLVYFFAAAITASRFALYSVPSFQLGNVASRASR